MSGWIGWMCECVYPEVSVCDQVRTNVRLLDHHRRIPGSDGTALLWHWPMPHTTHIRTYTPHAYTCTYTCTRTHARTNEQTTAHAHTCVHTRARDERTGLLRAGQRRQYLCCYSADKAISQQAASQRLELSKATGQEGCGRGAMGQQGNRGQRAIGQRDYG